MNNIAIHTKQFEHKQNSETSHIQHKANTHDTQTQFQLKYL